MSEQLVLNVEARSDLGKGASRRLRRLADKVPAVIYGDNKEPASIQMSHKDIHKLLENEASYSSVLTISMDGQEQPAILKGLQRHPAKDRIMHADFLRVDPNKKIHVNVPLHFANEAGSTGVKMQGGIVSHSATDIEVSCLPGDLPEYIEIDMTEIELGQIVHLSDIVLPKGVESIALSHGADHDLPVAQIIAPKGEKIDEEAEGEAAEDGEGGDEEAASEE